VPGRLLRPEDGEKAAAIKGVNPPAWVGSVPPLAEPRFAAARAGVPGDWLDDAVKGLLGRRGDHDPYLELPHLRVYVARPEYLLAMKCAAMRPGEEFRDVDDVRYLLRYLNLTSADEAMAIVTRSFDEKQLLPGTRLALEELLPG